MREIKFRAWDAGKGMRYFDLDDLMYGTHEIDTVDFKYWKVMQYTGLKDKNGKEIYEGDVVMYEDTESEYVDVGIGNVKVAEQQCNSFAEVKFENGCFGVQITEGELFGYYKGFHSFEWWSNEMASTATLEVIGNIYENPELLTK